MKKFTILSLLSIPALSYGIAYQPRSAQQKAIIQPQQQPTDIKKFNLHKVKPTDSNLFKEVKADNNIVNSEIDFWGRQVAEHALFAYLGLVNKDLKEQAKQLYQELQSFRKKWQSQPSKELANALLPLLEKQRNFQVQAIDLLNSGKWIGWIYPSLLKHMTMELDYFVDKLNAVPYNVAKETAFWKKEAHDRIGVIAHLLDPSEQNLVAQATDISNKYFNIPEDKKEQFLNSAIKAINKVNEFSEFYDANKQNIKSIINDALAAHELREGKRGEQILKIAQSK